MAREIITEEKLEKFQTFLTKNKDRKGSLMLILNECQRIFGCIPLELQKVISDELKIPMAEIFGVITFYHQFSLTPKGDYIIGVCMGTACYVKNAYKLLAEITSTLKVNPGETTPDYKFTLEATRCVGSCGLAPVVNVNEDTYEKLKSGDMADILAKY